MIEFLQEEGDDLGLHLNADSIAKSELSHLDAETAARTAQQLVRDRRLAAMADGIDYSWETVMSHPSHVEHLGEAVEAGYHVRVMYVCIDDPEVNVARVEERVDAGGHPVEEASIRKRYPGSIQNLAAAIVVSHMARIYDNSSAAEPMRQVAVWDGNTLWVLMQPQPTWFGPTVATFQAQGYEVIFV